MARGMLLHASAHSKQGIDSTMWPMAVQYATYVSNMLPRANNISPSDLFFVSRVPRHKFAKSTCVGVSSLCSQSDITVRQQDPQVGTTVSLPYL